MANVDPSLSIDDAARHYGLSARTIRRYIKDRKLGAFKRTTERGFEWRVYPDQSAANDPGNDSQTRPGIDNNDRQQMANVADNDSQPAMHSIIEVVPASSEISRLLGIMEQIQAHHQEATERVERENQRLREDNDLWKRRAIEAEEQVKLLMAPKDEPEREPEPTPEPGPSRPWWKRLFG